MSLEPTENTTAEAAPKKKNACSNCNEILSAASLTCEFCGHVVQRVVPQQPAGFTQPLGNSALDEPLASWHLRCGMHTLDAVFAIPLALIPFGSVVYNLLKDGLANGASLGKRVGDARVVDSTTGEPCTFGQSAGRNAILMIPFMIFIELFLMWKNGERLGDRLAGTKVIRPRSAGPPPMWGLWVSIGAITLSFMFLALICAAIAVPIFMSVRDSSDKASCAANQRTLTTAIEMYRADKHLALEDRTQCSPALIAELRKGGYLSATANVVDPGQGTASQGDYYTDKDGTVACRIHGHQGARKLRTR